MKDSGVITQLGISVVERIVLAERDCISDWMAAAEALSGNPLRVERRGFGQATALVCGAIPAQAFNRVFNMTYADRLQIIPILDLYRSYNAAPLFDLSPYSSEPYWRGENIEAVLARHGFYAGAFHQMLYARPAPQNLPVPEGITIDEVGPDETGVLGSVYSQVWGDPAVLAALVGRPEFRCYIAYVGGRPAGLGVLHIADGTASMANALTLPQLRNQGVQTALLQRRIEDAAAARCDLLVSQCSPGTQSERNQLRAGFHLAGTKSWWVRLNGPA